MAAVPPGNDYGRWYRKSRLTLHYFLGLIAILVRLRIFPHPLPPIAP
jgi:hypothetical protein